MRYLVLTDIHANLEALDACLTDAGPRGWDTSLVLGDLVGYGADPNAVIARVRALQPAAIIRGNHDKVACGLDDAESFNPVAKSAARWTFNALTKEHRDWLAALPRGPIAVDETVEICHGSPFDEDAYIFDEMYVHRALSVASRPLCLFGHTHCPAKFVLSSLGSDRAWLLSPADLRITLEANTKYLVNPGAVGQPRDNDPRAAYAIVDTAAASVELFRVRYPVQQAQAKIVKAGLPDVLASRLAIGR